MVYRPDHPFAGSNGYVREHRLIIEEHLGRFLEKTELIHHMNHDKTDNKISNLVLTDRVTHRSKDHPQHRDEKGRFKL